MPPSPLSIPSLPAVRPTGRVLIVDDNAELVDTLRAVIASGVPGFAEAAADVAVVAGAVGLLEVCEQPARSSGSTSATRTPTLITGQS